MDLPSGRRREYVESRVPKGDTLEDALSLLEGVEDVGEFLEDSPHRTAFNPALPSHIGAYEVSRVLGWGSMGVVYLARQESPDRLVAIKVLRLDASSPVMSRRFEQEGALLARFSDPGIATIIESGSADLGVGEQPFLVMEYVDGLPINKYADEKKLGLRARVKLMVALARSVQHAHSRNVLHRDLKPENVLVRPDGTPCVLDFGVAHLAAEPEGFLTMTATGQVIGTLAYMAPEQARGAQLGFAADLFALGAMLYELVCGELPFDVRGRLPIEALRIIADGDCRPPTQFNNALEPDLEAILLTGLAPEPALRFASVEAFADDLERYLAGEPVLARPPSSLETLSRFVRRNRKLSTTLLVSLVALGALLTWGASSLLRAERATNGAALFSDAHLLSTLEAEARELWPTSSSTIEAFDSWLDRAQGLRERLPHHQRTMQRIQVASASSGRADESMESIWLRGEGVQVVPAIQGMLAELAPEMEKRALTAHSMRQATTLAFKQSWSEARRRVSQDKRFSSFDLLPQEGLVPLGPDPGSQLEEFGLYGFGEVPGRDAVTERISPKAAHTIVFVLIPGGDLWIGAQKEDPASPNYDVGTRIYPEEDGCEGPPTRIRLDPFLLSKYEMTQAQWIRLAGSNTSDWEAGSTQQGIEIGLTNPVETVSWEQSQFYLRRIGLTLPTEAQWETAAGGGAPDAYMMGAHFTSLDGHANWNTHISQERWEGQVVIDEFATHRPVGDLLPNRYGLHDMMGNVWEFCLDNYKVPYHFLEHRPGDGLVICEPDGDASRRGGSSGDSPAHMRLWTRGYRLYNGGDALTGFRPARKLQLVE